MKQVSSLLLLFIFIWLSLISGQCRPPKQTAAMAYFVADSVVVSSAEIRVVAGRVDGVDSQLNVIQERLEKIDQILSTPSTIVSPYTGDDK